MVATAVAQATGGEFSRRGGSVMVTWKGLDGEPYIYIEFNPDKVPFMVSVRGWARPFESAVGNSSLTAKHIVDVLVRQEVLPKGRHRPR